MIANKKREDLVEKIYSLIAENERLKRQGAANHSKLIQLDRIFLNKGATIWGMLIASMNAFFFWKKEKDFFIKLYNYNFEIMNKDKAFEALQKMGAFESNEIAVQEYHDYAVNILGVDSNCKKCGRDIVQRLHESLQGRTLRIIKKNFPDLQLKPDFSSGKYSSSHYKENVPIMTFSGLEKLKASMKQDIAKNTSFGKRDIAKSIQGDLKSLEGYIKARKLGRVEYVPEPTEGAESKEGLQSSTNLGEDEFKGLGDEPVEPVEPVEEVEPVEPVEDLPKSKEDIIAYCLPKVEEGEKIQPLAEKFGMTYNKLYGWLNRAKKASK